MKAGTNGRNRHHSPALEKRVVIVFHSDCAGEMLDMLVGAGASIDLVDFVSPTQAVYIGKIMQMEKYYMPQ